MGTRRCVILALIVGAGVCAAARSCQDHEFLCGQNRCLPKRWKCDGYPDCEDGSDEKGCRPPRRGQDGCQPHEFICNNTNCIPRNWQCDGHDDCGDGSDERADMCSKCAPGEFKCVADGQCVSGDYVCNSVVDCEDGSDEADCPPQPTLPPSSDHFYCDNGRRIPYRWKCDGSNDCQDSSDERNCQGVNATALPSLCLNGEVQCGMTCIMERWLCDGKVDCEDGSDERDCPEICPEGLFKCTNAGCVAEERRCDGVKDCVDGSDEEGCESTSATVQPPPPATRTNDTCDPETKFSCGSDKCIPKQRLCDGINDCPGGEDELIAICGIDECREKNGGCEHICVNTRDSYYCECRAGYRLGRKFNCEDIDECVEVPGSCSQKCTNTIGSFHCSCLPGYRRDPRNYTRCKADSGDPYLIFSHSYDIRSLRLKDRELTTLVNDTRRATALDFQYSTNQLIWCDNKDRKIKRAHMTNPEMPEVLLEKDQMVVDGLAVDWIHQNIYFTDVSEIHMISWDGRWVHTIVTDKLDRPRAIVANPIDGYIYWTDWGSPPKIDRAGLDGSDRTTLVSAPDIHWPNGITLDYANKKLYWCDGYLSTIRMSNMDGTGIETVLYSAEVLRLPYSVTVFEDRMYWVDWSQIALFSADKFNGDNVEHISAGHLLEAPKVVHVFHQYRQPSGENVCRSHSCSHFCVRSSQGRPVCLCPNGYWLSRTDGTTCLNASVAIITQSASEEEVVISSRTEPLVPSAVFGPHVGGGSTSQDKTVIEVSSPQAGMVLGVVLGSLVVLGLAIGMFVGYVKMRRRVIIHTRFPNPVYRKTTGLEEDGGGYTIEQDGLMFLQQEYDYSEPQNKVLIDGDDAVLLSPKK